jgi:hypothetical protein
VANLDEVAEVLSRTRYARFLPAAVTADGAAL